MPPATADGTGPWHPHPEARENIGQSGIIVAGSIVWRLLRALWTELLETDTVAPNRWNFPTPTTRWNAYSSTPSSTLTETREPVVWTKAVNHNDGQCERQPAALRDTRPPGSPPTPASTLACPLHMVVSGWWGSPPANGMPMLTGLAGETPADYHGIPQRHQEEFETDPASSLRH